MTMKIVKDPRWSAIKKDGSPAIGAKLFVRNSGTSELSILFSDALMQIPCTNPLIADERGYFPVFYSDDSQQIDIAIISRIGETISEIKNWQI